MPGLNLNFLKSLEADYSSFHYFVETGTFRAVTISTMEPYFNKLFTIEVAEPLWKAAKTKYQKKSKINFILGDSSKEIPKLIKNELDKPTIFFLDGHYSAGVTGYAEKHVPLYEELTSIINDFKSEAIIIIDDIRIFGKLDSGICDWRDINIESCLDIIKERMSKHYFRPSCLDKNDRLVVHINSSA